MDVEGINLTLKDLLTPPPVMPWREFADWIRMSEDHPTVWGWIRNGYLRVLHPARHLAQNLVFLLQKLGGVRAV